MFNIFSTEWNYLINLKNSCGNSKPYSAIEYLEGKTVNMKIHYIYKCIIIAFIFKIYYAEMESTPNNEFCCDMPARCFLKCYKLKTAYIITL